MKEFPELFKRLRKARRLTQKELAEKLGITRTMVSAYENAMRLPGHETLTRIALFFCVSMDYLYGINDREVMHPTHVSEKLNTVISAAIDYKNDSKES